MNLRDYGSRTKFLLRIAPWADLELVREQVTERLLKLCELPDYLSDVHKTQIAEFAEGKRHVVRSSLRGNRAVAAALAHLYPTQRDTDRKYHDAQTEFQNYFFATDNYLGINQ